MDFSSISDYFKTSGGNDSGGSGGGPGFKSDQTAQGEGENRSTQQTARGGLFGIAGGSVGESVDRSSFTAPFFQEFGGIQNNQGSGLTPGVIAIICVALVAGVYFYKKA
jgi:hypothetical protein